jgi:hypothetical protein
MGAHRFDSCCMSSFVYQDFEPIFNTRLRAVYLSVLVLHVTEQKIIASCSE